MKTNKRDKGIKGKPTQDINTCNENSFTPISHAFDMIHTTLVANEITDICCLINDSDNENE